MKTGSPGQPSEVRIHGMRVQNGNPGDPGPDAVNNDSSANRPGTPKGTGTPCDCDSIANAASGGNRPMEPREQGQKSVSAPGRS